MTPTARPDSAHLTELVALSLLRAGLDTQAARHARDVIPTHPPSDWLDVVAAEIWPDRTERWRQVASARGQVDAVVRLAASGGHRAVTCLDPDYPPLLRAIPDPPVVLWCQGSVEALMAPAVALVGSRNATPTSVAVARKLGRELAEAGLVVVSGLARGVDGAAHLGALDAGGRTIAVQGRGLNLIYPRQHAALAARIRESGAVVSELPADRPPLPPHFPLRNRIISGLSLATVVVEAGQGSGSLITARAALEQGRDVLAVPGGILSGNHSGCHALIKDGARLVDSVEDVLDEIGWVRRPAERSEIGRNRLQLSGLEAKMAEGEPYSVDNLAAATGQSASALLAQLCLLELSGRVSRVAGGRFVRGAGRAGGVGG